MNQITPVPLAEDHSDLESMEEIRKEMRNYSSIKEDSFDFEEDANMKEIFDTKISNVNRRQVEAKRRRRIPVQATTDDIPKKVEEKFAREMVDFSPFGVNSVALGTLSIGDDFGEENTRLKKTVIIL